MSRESSTHPSTRDPNENPLTLMHAEFSQERFVKPQMPITRGREVFLHDGKHLISSISIMSSPSSCSSLLPLLISLTDWSSLSLLLISLTTTLSTAVRSHRRTSSPSPLPPPAWALPRPHI
jgi:hypothetical protein